MAALIDLWKTSPAQVEQKTVQQILAFAGDGKLKHDNPTSLEFRDFLGRVPSDLLGAYANQCLDLKGFTDSGLALQDVVNQIGRRLGFHVENGRYRGTPGAIGYDGLWITKQGDAIIVEVKTTDAYRLWLETAAIYATPDERTAVYCGTSREYERTQGTGYWFGFRATQKEILDEYEKAWVSFGCGSESQLLVIPLAEFARWLERFNKTENEQHDFWHIHIRSQKQKWFIEARTGFDSIEVSKYFL